MARYFFEISYFGKPFFGWQKQPKALTVQEEIETQLSKLFGSTAIVGCGRTDTGVHAANYFFHVELNETSVETDKLIFKLNRMLPPSVVIHRIFPCDLHARFDATKRTYRYFIHSAKNAFLTDTSWYVPQALDMDAMNEAAKHLLGKQDFTSLSKLHTDVKTNICDVSAARWHNLDDQRCYFEISADRFLRNMVRATVGTLVDVGLGKLAAEDIPVILEKKNRGAASTSVPAHGLFLWQIDYNFE